jgi:hypothetical protein
MDWQTIRRATGWVVLGVVCALLVYDAVVVLVWGGRTTVSAVIIDLSVVAPIVAHATGILAGHWFWPFDPEKPLGRLQALGILLSLFAVGWLLPEARTSLVCCAFLSGFVAGHAYWKQRRVAG